MRAQVRRKLWEERKKLSGRSFFTLNKGIIVKIVTAVREAVMAVMEVNYVLKVKVARRLQT